MDKHTYGWVDGRSSSVSYSFHRLKIFQWHLIFHRRVIFRWCQQKSFVRFLVTHDSVCSCLINVGHGKGNKKMRRRKQRTTAAATTTTVYRTRIKLHRVEKVGLGWLASFSLHCSICDMLQFTFYKWNTPFQCHCARNSLQCFACAWKCCTFLYYYTILMMMTNKRLCASLGYVTISTLLKHTYIYNDIVVVLYNIEIIFHLCKSIQVRFNSTPYKIINKINSCRKQLHDF